MFVCLFLLCNKVSDEVVTLAGLTETCGGLGFRRVAHPSQFRLILESLILAGVPVFSLPIGRFSS